MQKRKKREKEREKRKTEAAAHRKRENYRRSERTLVITLNVNGYSQPVSSRVALSRSLYFFFSSSL
jgi:hypothetical protein